MFLSYAQNFEDVILRRVLRDVARGFFVDVGAHDPEFMSLTKAFTEMGWRGINIEPSSTFDKFPSARPNDINLNCAVSDHDGTATLHEYPDGPGLTRLDSVVTEVMKSHTQRVIKQTVPVRTLTSIFEEHATAQVVDFMSIDVEGHERAVLTGNDWQRFRPRVLVIEATETLTEKPTHHLWEEIVRSARYVFAYFDGLNRYYVRVEDAQLLPLFGLPPNVFDEFTPARVHQLDRQVIQLHEHIAKWKTAHDNAVTQTEMVIAENQATLLNWKNAHDNAVGQVVEARAEVETLKTQTQELYQANRAACESLEQAATQIDHLQARNEQLNGQLAELGAKLSEAQRVTQNQDTIISEYRGLCRGTSGRPLKVGLWLARLISALRFKPRPPYPV
jgi:FkbM family methyltransferase